MKFDKAMVTDLVKLSTFLISTGLATLLLATLLANGLFSSGTEYKAMFSDVTGVSKGDDVRVAGVAVGSVKGVDIIDRTKAVVTFVVDEDVPLTANTNADIRFRNLVGQRYMALTQGSDGARSALKAGETIPMERTDEALDLNVLFNGFKPLFEGLSPDDINKLALELIKVLQGEGGNVKTLLASTSSVTQTLADRDKLIGDVITNLSQVLDTVGDNDEELSETIDTLQQFTTGLKEDRGAILGSLDSISELTVTTADLLTDARAPLKDDIGEVNRLAKGLNTPSNKQKLSETLQITPIKYKKLGNTATTGGFFNFYLCQLRGTIELPAIPALELDEPQEFTLGDPESGVNLPSENRCDEETFAGTGEEDTRR